MAFATKPALATAVITHALDVGVPAAWVAGDEVYGANPYLREALEACRMGYVLAVACDHRVPTRAGKLRADTLAGRLPERAWQQRSAGAGAKGLRLYDWAMADLTSTQPGHHQALVRRNHRTGELAFYLCYSPQTVPLGTLVRVAGSRWRVAETFQPTKALAGLDEHQVRRWVSWRRWVTLAMVAQAFLAVVRADEHAQRSQLDQLIPLTCNKIQHLFTHLVVQLFHDAAHRLRWSHWRRRHHTRARISHYRRQSRRCPHLPFIHEHRR